MSFHLPPRDALRISTLQDDGRAQRNPAAGRRRNQLDDPEKGIWDRRTTHTTKLRTVLFMRWEPPQDDRLPCEECGSRNTVMTKSGSGEQWNGLPLGFENYWCHACDHQWTEI